MTIPPFVYLLIDRHSGCFLFLAVMNKALKTFLHMSFYECVYSFMLGLYLGGKWLGHMVSVDLTF